MLLCDECNDSQWSVEEIATGHRITCRGCKVETANIRLTNDGKSSMGWVYEECGRYFDIPHGVTFVPTTTRTARILDEE